MPSKHRPIHVPECRDCDFYRRGSYNSDSEYIDESCQLLGASLDVWDHQEVRGFKVYRPKDCPLQRLSDALDVSWFASGGNIAEIGPFRTQAAAWEAMEYSTEDATTYGRKHPSDAKVWPVQRVRR